MLQRIVGGAAGHCLQGRGDGVAAEKRARRGDEQHAAAAGRERADRPGSEAGNEERDGDPARVFHFSYSHFKPAPISVRRPTH